MTCGKCGQPIYKDTQVTVICKNITITNDKGGFNLFGDFLKNYKVYHDECLSENTKNNAEKNPLGISCLEDQVIKGLRELGINDSVNKIKKFIWQNIKFTEMKDLNLNQPHMSLIKEFLLQKDGQQ